MSTNEELELELFSLDGTVVTECHVSNVYDGDSFTISAKFPQLSQPCSFKCRLGGVDTPELRTKDADEKKLAVCARDRVRDLVANVGVQAITCGVFGKYGRLIVSVVLKGGMDLARLLIDEKLAVVYDGTSSRKRAEGFWSQLTHERQEVIIANQTE